MYLKEDQLTIFTNTRNKYTVQSNQARRSSEIHWHGFQHPLTFFPKFLTVGRKLILSHQFVPSAEIWWSDCSATFRPARRQYLHGVDDGAERSGDAARVIKRRASRALRTLKTAVVNYACQRLHRVLGERRWRRHRRRRPFLFALDLLSLSLSLSLARSLTRVLTKKNEPQILSRTLAAGRLLSNTRHFEVQAVRKDYTGSHGRNRYYAGPRKSRVRILHGK